ncbi:MAG TPA: S53 family peptidase [Polyangiaceae bacterium]|nr:S53 family peptidase [Polyangiaceae bacterium]
MSTRKIFHDSVMELPPQPGPTGRLMVKAADSAHLNESLPVHFSFEIPKEAEAELARRVEAGEQVSASELDSKYSLTAADTAPLRKWLQENGYTNIEESPDHMGVSASATAQALHKSLNVDFVRVTKEGITYTAARNAPSLPQDVAAKVHGISGLQPFRHLKKHRVYRLPAPTAAAAEAAAGKHAAVAPPFLPSALLKAFDGVQSTLDGSGQTIGILIDTFPHDADLTKFWAAAKVPGSLSRIHKINVNNTTLPVPEGEESLDVEWTSGIAPGANINVYATGSLAFAPLNAGLRKILDDAKSDPSLRVVSISLGLGEQETPPAAMRTQNQIFLRLAALGVNVTVSTGDDGSTPQGVLETEYPSSDPNVIAVGGTTLVLKSDSSIQTETGWSGSGGGKSVKFKRPTWQTGKGVTPGSTRLVPDVAAAADPNTGALVVLNNTGQQIGGTSWAAPTWAGILALINQARVNSNKPRLPFLNPRLYPLNGSSSFRDVTSGSNGAYHSTAGHDLVTGLGSPGIRSLTAALLEAP